MVIIRKALASWWWRKKKAGHELKLKSFLDAVGRPSGPEEVGQLPRGHILWQFRPYSYKRLSSFPELLLSHYSFFLFDYFPLPFPNMFLFFQMHFSLSRVCFESFGSTFFRVINTLSLSTALCSPNTFNLSKLNFNVVKENILWFVSREYF